MSHDQFFSRIELAVLLKSSFYLSSNKITPHMFKEVVGYHGSVKFEMVLQHFMNDLSLRGSL